MKWKEQAIDKLTEGRRSVAGQKEKIMAGHCLGHGLPE